ncbi:MAG: M20 family metallopeptidase [Mycobacteriales bacterium]
MNGDGLLAAAELRSAAMAEWLADLVACESPSNDAVALARCADLLAGYGAEAFGYPPERVVVDGRTHLLWRPGATATVLLLGHYDTVWPLGTLADWPYTVDGDRATGPGTFDMKAGIVQMLAAVALARVPDRVALLLTADEEIASGTSRALIEEQAGTVGAVLVGEPSADGGRLKTARKGGATYRLRVTGRAAHAGLEPERGVNATVELAHQVTGLAALADPAWGTTVTPTVLSGGTTTNTVPESAQVAVDVRAWTATEQDRVDAALRGLAPVLPGARLEVSGGVHRRPLEETASGALHALAERAADDVGLELPPPARSGGASDGNLTAALGIPTLDGLGAVGEYPHGRGEYVLLSALAPRAALLARLLQLLAAR